MAVVNGFNEWLDLRSLLDLGLAHGLDEPARVSVDSGDYKTVNYSFDRYVISSCFV